MEIDLLMGKAQDIAYGGQKRSAIGSGMITWRGGRRKINMLLVICQRQDQLTSDEGK